MRKKKNEDKERRGEREGKRGSTFSLRSMELGWSSRIEQDLKLEYSSRATRGHQNQKSSSEIRARSSGNQFGFRKCPHNFLNFLLRSNR